MIGILTISHKRPAIDKAWCLMIERIREDYADIFTPIVAVSLEEDKKVFEEHKIETYLFPNAPLGEKLNFIFSKAKGRFTNILLLGSDDIVDNNYIDELLKNQDKDIAWGTGLTFYSAGQKKARFWDEACKYVAGAGKFISAGLLDHVDWATYTPGINTNTDHDSWNILLPFMQSKHNFKVKDIRGLLLGIKSEVNMHPFHDFINNGMEADLDNIYRKLSQKEVEYLKSLN